MFVYIDESGNTGKNIADENSPIFYHLALLSKYNLDLDLNHRIKPILEKYNLKELHAVENHNIIEDIAPTILKVLRENSVSFYYAEVDKSYLAYAKLFDTLFDNVENIGARWEAYQIRPLRLMLLCNLIGILDKSVAFDFYKNCLMANSQQQAEDSLRRTCKQILSETYKLQDSRSKTIIEDTINGAKYYPTDISMFEKEKQNRWRHLPHIVSFLPMLSAISVYSKEHNTKVQKIIHDEQEQVQNVITEMHQVAAESGKHGIWDLMENGQFDFTRIIENSFEMKDSEKSYGIQITDVCLSILRQGITDLFSEPNKYKLFDYIQNHIIDKFLFNEKILRFEAFLWYEKIMKADISMEKIEEGKKLVEKMEKDFYDKLFVNNKDKLS